MNFEYEMIVLWKRGLLAIFLHREYKISIFAAFCSILLSMIDFDFKNEDYFENVYCYKYPAAEVAHLHKQEGRCDAF